MEYIASMQPRIAPAQPPFPDQVQAALDAVMRGRAPLGLFTTLARDPRLFRKFFSGGLLDKGHLSLRQRELVICRTTALCGSEYEWGVHVGEFGEAAALTPAQLHSLVFGQPEDDCWTGHEKPLLRACDALHRDCSLPDPVWEALRESLSELAVMEVLMLAGFYRTVSYLTNGLRLPLEPGAGTFESVRSPRV